MPETARSDNIFSAMNDALGFAVLRRSVGAGHPKLHAIGEEERSHGRVVKLVPVVALNISMMWPN